jgi:outer membrane protein assembly factor BamB
MAKIGETVPPRGLCWITGFLLVALAATYGTLAWLPSTASSPPPLLDYRAKKQSTPADDAAGPRLQVKVLHRRPELDPDRLPAFSKARPAEPWTQFRGATGQGHASGPAPPLTWSETENIAWKIQIPGDGWSCPVIQGNQIWLTTALERSFGLRAICLDRNSGELVYDVPVFAPATAIRVHPKNNYATPTPIIDGDRVYVHFGPFGTACLSTSGKVLWRAEQGYAAAYGPTSSPVLFEDLLLIQCDGTDVRYTLALDKHTGQVRWQRPREGRNSEATPLVVEAAGGHQLVSSLAGRVLASDLRTGADIWWAAQGDNYAQVPRPVSGNGMVFTCGGFFDPVVTAIRVDGTGDVSRTHVAWRWRHASVPQIASPLLVGDELYLVSTPGIATCLDARSGKVRWRERLGGEFSASPIFAGGRIYLINENAATTVLAPGPKFRRLALNQLEGTVRASPAVYDGALYVRTDHCLYRIERRPSTGRENKEIY